MQLCTGNEDELRRLLMDTTLINATDQSGNTPLIIAAIRGDRPQYMNAENHNSLLHLFLGIGKSVQVLIEKGAYVNALDNDNFSPLVHAAWRGDITNY